MIEPKSYFYVYPITRDFGFAPNPFHGVCTLGTCKPDIRKSAKIGDWVMGIGGSNLKSVAKKCIFLMKVVEKLDFQSYWDDPRFSLKKPVRNGSRVQMLGDNIYHRDNQGIWLQEDSHHSNADGSPNDFNLERDTGKTDQVLVSDMFFYFGSSAVDVDLDSIDYGRIRNYRKIDTDICSASRRLIESIVSENRGLKNYIFADPCQYIDSHKRADQESGKVSH